MRVSASVANGDSHKAAVRTGDAERELIVPAKTTGKGSAVSGGEFLMLALATCYCNDIYREAARLGIEVDRVEVEASADFEGVGLAASNICYRAKVQSSDSDERVAQLLRETDAVAEIHNTVRAPIAVRMLPWNA